MGEEEDEDGQKFDGFCTNRICLADIEVSQKGVRNMLEELREAKGEWNHPKDTSRETIVREFLYYKLEEVENDVNFPDKGRERRSGSPAGRVDEGTAA